jgi:hypothetical protein
MLSQFPNVTAFKPVSRGKLFLHEEQPEAVAQLVGEFLTDVV